MTCSHDMERAWCYLCRVEAVGSAGPAAWGLDVVPRSANLRWQLHRAPMTQRQAEYLRFLCDEFGVSFQDSLTEGEADLLIESFLNEPMTESQRRTLESLSGQRPEPGEGPTYGVARAEIRRLVEIKAMRDLAGGAYSSSI